MSRFGLLRHHLLATTGGGGGFTPPTGALRTGLNFTATSWNNWVWQDRFPSSGAWLAVPASGSNVGLPAANIDSNYWATSVPSGYVYVSHPVVHTPSTNQGESYQICWNGNMGATGGHAPVNNTFTTISSINLTDKTCIATPTNSVPNVPMFIQFSIDPADTAAGTYPGGPNAGLNINGGTGIEARPVGETIQTYDPAILASVTPVLNGPLRLMRSSGVEQNDGPSNPPSSLGTQAPWGADDATQDNPRFKITMANRAGPTSGVWMATDGGAANNPSVAWSGIPVEKAVEIANYFDCDLWWNEHWNADPEVTRYNAAYLRDNLNADRKVYVEISNEVWNSHYDVCGQAAREAGYNTNGTANSTYAALRADGTSMPWVAVVASGMNASRYAEKLIEVHGYYSTVFAAASSQPGGVKPTLKRVCAWWHTQRSTMAAALLDYTPPGASGPLKSFVDVYATSPYVSPVNVDPTLGSTYNGTRGVDPLMTGLWYDTENEAQIVKDIRAVCDARGLEYAFYEMSDMELIAPDTTTNADIAASLHRDPRLGTWLKWTLSRFEAATPGTAMCYYAFVGSINSRDGTFALLEDPVQDPSGATPAPTYLAYKSYILGERDLVDLDGQLIARVGAQVGEIVGYVRRRTPGSTISVASPFGVADSTAQVLAITVASASAFASAGTASCAITETGGNPSTSNTTTFTCQITANTFWTANRNTKYMTLDNSDGVKDTTGRTCRNIISDGSDVTAFASLPRANGYWEFTVGPVAANKSKIALVGPTFPNTLNPYWSSLSVCWTNDSGGVVVRNGSVLSAWDTWTANDAIDAFLSTSGKLYGRKNNGSWMGVPHVLPFTGGNNNGSGTNSIAVGDTITGGTSGHSAKVGYIQTTSGTWAAGTAAGNIYLNPTTGTFTTGETVTNTKGYSIVSGVDPGAPTVDPSTDTGGVDVSALLTSTGGTVSPACSSETPGFGGVARFADADFIHTKPTGAHDWNS